MQRNTILIEDDRQKVGKHVEKNRYWYDEGRRVYRCRLPFGDYALVRETDLRIRGLLKININLPFGQLSFSPQIIVDTKQNIAELATDLINDHARFKRECVAAQDAGVLLVILVENREGVENLSDLHNWLEPIAAYKKRKGKARRIGSTLAKQCNTMHERYGVCFSFCKPEKSGARVIEILERGEEWIMKNKQEA